jgi:bacteriocin-like protein
MTKDNRKTASLEVELTEQQLQSVTGGKPQTGQSQKPKATDLLKFNMNQVFVTS